MQFSLWSSARKGRVRQELIYCPEKHRLRDELLEAIHEMNELQSEQTRALVEGDEDFSRFDVLLHLAHERKEASKYAWLAHVESHGCQEA